MLTFKLYKYVITKCSKVERRSLHMRQKIHQAGAYLCFLYHRSISKRQYNQEHSYSLWIGRQSIAGLLPTVYTPWKKQTDSKVSCLRRQCKCPQLGLKIGPLDPEARALTMSPPCLQQINQDYKYVDLRSWIKTLNYHSESRASDDAKMQETDNCQARHQRRDTS